MRSKRLALTVMVVCLIAGTALAQMPNPFSADEVITPANNSMPPMTGKLYFDGTGRMRMDMNMHGQSAYSIVDTKKRVFYSVMPQQKMYMEMAADQMDKMGRNRPDFTPFDAGNPCANMTGFTCSKVGTETVNGRSCDKWEFTSKSNGQKHWAWIDQQNHIPIKTVTPDGTTMELRNLQEGSQPASLFEVPADYRKMDMGGMMKNLPAKSQ